MTPRLVYLSIAVLVGTAAGRATPGPAIATEADSLALANGWILRGRTAEAESLAQRAARRIAPATRADSLRLADALDMVAEAQRNRVLPARVDSAAAARAVALRTSLQGPEDVATARSLRRLGWVQSAMGSPRDALATLGRALPLLEAGLGREHADVGICLEDLGVARRASGEEERARRHFEQALRILERVLPPDHPELARLLLALARAEMGAGVRATVRPLLERAVSIREKAYGSDHPGVANVLYDLGRFLLDQGAGMEASAVLERTVAIRQTALGDSSAYLADAMTLLGAALANRGEDARAFSCYERALAIFERRQGPDGPAVGWVLNNMGTLRSEAEDYAAARPLLERAMAVREKALGPDHEDFAWTLITLGDLHMGTGDYAKAEQLLKRGLEIMEKRMGPEHLNLTNVLQSLGQLHEAMGDYPEARRYLERELAIERKAYGSEEPPAIAYTLGVLATVLHKLGDGRRAKELFARAIEILERRLGADGLGVAIFQNNVAHVHLALGETEEALSLFERSAATTERQAGPDAPNLGRSLANLGVVRGRLGQFDAARADLRRALGILEARLGTGHHSVGSAIRRLGEVELAAGRLDSAGVHLRRALTILEPILGAEHPKTAELLFDMARVEHAAGRKREAFDLAVRVEEIQRQHMRQTVRALEERQALAFGARLSPSLYLALTLASDSTPDFSPFAAPAWDAVTRSRALVLDEIGARHRTVSRAAAVVRLAEAYATAQRRLANLLVRQAGDTTSSAQLALLDGARAETEQAELALADASGSFRETHSLERAGLEQALRALPPRSVLVGFALYARQSPRPATGPVRTPAPPVYLAFASRGGTDSVAVIPLRAASTIDSAVAAWRADARSPAAGSGAPGSEARYRKSGRALRSLVWDPLAPYLAGAERVFIVPDGSLHLVNFAALPDDGGGYLVESGPTVHYLGAERDLCRPAVARTGGAGLLALGDPDYNHSAEPDGGEPLAATPEPASDTIASAGPYRGAAPACASFARIRWQALPQTAAEVGEVATLWADRISGGGAAEGSPAGTETRPALVHLTGTAAGEGSFKNAAPGRRVLHLATHGFFLGGECAGGGEARGIGGISPSKLQPADDASADPAAESPLLLSGLVLAGANSRSREHSSEDGILTAEEIAAMDLGGVEWAVLSACETGVGEIRAGEGVFGLRRAFQVAGARTLIMSLWSVEDRAAREWMRHLYEGRWTRRLDTAAAVREAGRKALAERKARGESTHPFYWGAFVAAGDWR